MLLSLFFAGIEQAIAQGIWDAVPCSELQPGCGEAPANVLENALPNLAVLMLQISTALAVLFVVWAGIRMITSFGDDSADLTQRMAIIYALMGLFLAIASQLLVSFVVTQDFGQSTGPEENLALSLIASGVGVLLTILNGLLLFAVIYYAARLVMSGGDSGEYNIARNGLTTAVLGAIFVNTANALIQGITSFFGL